MMTGTATMNMTVVTTHVKKTTAGYTKLGYEEPSQQPPGPAQQAPYISKRLLMDVTQSLETAKMLPGTHRGETSGTKVFRYLICRNV